MVGNLPLQCLVEKDSRVENSQSQSIHKLIFEKPKGLGFSPASGSEVLPLVLVELAGQLLTSFPASLGGDGREGLAIYTVGPAPSYWPLNL